MNMNSLRGMASLMFMPLCGLEKTEGLNQWMMQYTEQYEY